MIVGAQWGDEGKGKIVDLLAAESDLVCRYQGGPNAGHTIVVAGETYKIRAIPSGIVAGVASAIGAGCVVDPAVLIGELDDLESRGHRTDGLVFVSGNAHLIMPWRVALDGAVNIHLTGCPNSCAQHYIGDIGLLGARVKVGGEAVEGYHVFVGGGFGDRQSVGRQVFHGLSFAEVKRTLERMLRAYLEQRTPGESFQGFTRRHDLNQLQVLFTPGA